MVLRTRRRGRAPYLALALSLSLVLSLALAAPAAAAPRAPDGNGPDLRPVGAWLESLVSRLERGVGGYLAGIWQPLGPGMDPDGEPSGQSSDGPIENPELGGGIDPNG